MSKVIRIGTRDSELALWQANTVKKQLEYLGFETTLVPVKSTGDLILDKPLHELGITGVFTKSLDVAMLKGEIDIAVHSLKDVPTVLPEGIVQAAVLKRGNFNDILVFKKNVEFLAQENAVIATGSLRRKAQWLNRYPSHSIEDLRGNVNTRLQKLKDNTWNGAIFAAAGLERIGLKPEDTIGLSWMIPAPAQGAIMIAALEKDEYVRKACAQLNHEETEICTTIERKFLNLLEGGCTAPIGALAFIRKEEITFKGILLNRDGTKKIEVELKEPLGSHHLMAQEGAEYILKRGGKRLMTESEVSQRVANVYSTKSLTMDQLHLFHDSIQVESDDFIKISPNRIAPAIVEEEIQNVIITSRNAVESLLSQFSAEALKFKHIYCVGRRTKKLIEQRVGKVTHTERNAEKLAKYLVEFMEGLEATYFCSNKRLDNLPKMMEENNLVLNEVVTYETKSSPSKVEEGVEGMLFFSPSTIESYLLENKPNKIAYCIGETTAKEARKHFDDVRVAKIPTVESVIDLVNENYKETLRVVKT